MDISVLDLTQPQEDSDLALLHSRQLDGRAPVDPPSAPARKRTGCQACRLRRVKCSYPTPTSDCLACQERGFQCLPMPPPVTKKTTRNGKRLEEARARFGKDSSAPPDCSQILPSSYASRITAVELNSAISSSLLDLFLTTQPTIAFIEDTGFRLKFEAAGRRFDQLEDQSQVLCACVLAVAARVSDNPLFAGSNAPRIAQLGDAARAGVDLTSFGQRREAICRQLGAKAAQMVDEKHTLRIASLESIGALMLVEALIDSDHLALTNSRPYFMATSSHARELLSTPGLTPHARSRLSSTVLGWTAYVRDALWAANAGTGPNFSEDDLWLLRDENDTDLPLDQTLAAPPHPDPIQSFWVLIVAFMDCLTKLGRAAAVKLTGARARAAEQINETFAAEYIAELELAWSAVPEILRRSDFFRLLKIKRSGQDVDTVVRSLLIVLYNMSFILNRVVTQRTDTRWKDVSRSARATIADGSPWPPISARPRDDNDPYWARLLRLQLKTRELAIRAARGVAQVIGGAAEAGMALGTYEVMDIRIIITLFGRLPIIIQLLLDAPTFEESGSFDFTFDVKLQELRSILKALYSVGWAHPRLANAEVKAWLVNEIAKVETAQAAFQLNSTSAFADLRQPIFDFPNLSAPFCDSFLSSSISAMGAEELSAMLPQLVESSDAGEEPNSWLAMV